MGLEGVVYAMGISYLSGAIFMFLYIQLVKPTDSMTWQPITKKSFDGMLDVMDGLADNGFT